jgi:hypothetical protein
MKLPEAIASSHSTPALPQGCRAERMKSTPADAHPRMAPWHKWIACIALQRGVSTPAVLRMSRGLARAIDSPTRDATNGEAAIAVAKYRSATACGPNARTPTARKGAVFDSRHQVEFTSRTLPRDGRPIVATAPRFSPMRIYSACSAPLAPAQTMRHPRGERGLDSLRLKGTAEE